MRERVPPDQLDRQADYRLRPRPVQRRMPVLKRAVVWGGVTDDQIAQRRTLDTTWTNLISADVSTWDRNDKQLGDLIATGATKPWCDCRVDGGTHPQAAIDFAQDLEIGWVGQAETAEELEWAVGIHRDGYLTAPAGSERAKEIIGNPNAWTQPQRVIATRMIEDGDLSVSGEQYAGPDAMVAYSTQGVPIDSITLGVAMDGDAYYPLDQLLAELKKRADAHKFLSTVLLWHGGGLRPGDWAAARTI